jgi:hypothetical protein
VYTYNPNIDNCTFLITRAVICIVDKHLSIRGGFTTNDWANNNPSDNLTDIDGNNNYRGIALIAYNSTASLVMEGFTIQNGKAQGKPNLDSWSASGRGGGLWSQGGRIELNNIIFNNNIAQGADTSTSLGGDATGGAIMLETVKDNSTSILTNITFQDNQALGGNGIQRGGVSLGGALFIYQSKVQGQNLIFRRNTAKAGNTNGSGEVNNLRADSLGGAISLQQNSNGIFQNLQAMDNIAIGGNSKGVGGGGFGGAISAEDSSLIVNDLYLFHNTAQGGSGQTGGFAMGGGLITDDSNFTVDRARIINNLALSGPTSGNGKPGCPAGGGLYLTAFTKPGSFTLNLYNLIVADNVIDIDNPQIITDGNGAGIVIQAITANIIHATIANNQFKDSSKFGQAIMVTGLGDSSTSASLHLSNSIISDHVNPFTELTSAITVVPGSSIYLDNVLFANNTNNLNDNSRPVPPGTINGINNILIAQDVNYISPGEPDFNYELNSNSPAIDRTTDVLSKWDYEGDQRPFGQMVDLGADEYISNGLIVTPNPIIRITDRNSILNSKINITSYNNNPVLWSATSENQWILLGYSTLSQQASGNTPTELIIQINPQNLNSGWNSSHIIISSPNTEPVTIEVKILVVDKLNNIFLPVIVK